MHFSFEGVDNSLGLTGYRPTGPISHDSLERYINILARTKIDCRWLTGGHQNWATDDEKCSPHVIMWCPEPDPWPVPQWGHMPHQEATHPETPKIYGLLRVLGGKLGIWRSTIGWNEETNRKETGGKGQNIYFHKLQLNNLENVEYKISNMKI